jgi:transposase
MIRVEQVWLVVQPVDMRLGLDGLSLQVQQLLGRSPCDGSAYVFRNRSGTRLKLVVWDGSGVWLCARRLFRGHFTWPNTQDPSWVLQPEEWRWLTLGVDWRRLSAEPPRHWQV